MIFLKVSIRDNSLAENERALEQGCALGELVEKLFVTWLKA